MASEAIDGVSSDKLCPKVTLLNYTQDAEKTCALAARLCYSSLDVSDLKDNMDEENVVRLLNTVINSGHLSVLEHASFTFAIEGISRNLTHQLVRHRIANYCLSGGTKVFLEQGANFREQKTIKELAEVFKQNSEAEVFLRCVNEETREITNGKVKKVISTGLKHLFEVKTVGGYSIFSTKEHRFFTENGWKQLEDLSMGDKVFVDEAAEKAIGNSSLVISLHKLVPRVRKDEISTITSIGLAETFDIEMFAPHHNFIANSFVVHNSQQSARYVAFDDIAIIEPPSIQKNSKASELFNQITQSSIKTYNELLQLGVPAEDARFVLPTGMDTKIIVTMNARALYNFFATRLCNRSQWEIRKVAWMMYNKANEIAPNLFIKAGCGCMNGKCPENKMTCGTPIKSSRKKETT